MTNPVFSIRQGDVLLVRVDAIPAGTTEEPTELPMIVKYGEATGHAHAFHSAAVKLYSSETGDRFLHILEPAQLQHEEHAAIDVPPGIYRLPDQVEWSNDGSDLIED